ncbi:hypothetical protein ACI2JA_15775 [Alkalihalobacillus sp. NPDC078783]
MRMYRPTVRYDEEFRKYVNNLFHATTLDRNQIIRAALFASAHSETFKGLISEHLKTDVPLSPLLWELSDYQLWMEQTWKAKEEKGDVKDDLREVITRRMEQKQPAKEILQSRPIEGRSGEIRVNQPSTIRREGRGLKVTIH